MTAGAGVPPERLRRVLEKLRRLVMASLRMEDGEADAEAEELIGAIDEALRPVPALAAASGPDAGTGESAPDGRALASVDREYEMLSRAALHDDLVASTRERDELLAALAARGITPGDEGEWLLDTEPTVEAYGTLEAALDAWRAMPDIDAPASAQPAGVAEATALAQGVPVERVRYPEPETAAGTAPASAAAPEERDGELERRLRLRSIASAAGGFDLVKHLHRQREFSERTFGPGARVKGVLDHIRKELVEIEQQPTDLSEWIDVVLLALDGAWRSGASPERIAAALASKQARNEKREWPDWRTADPDRAITHVRATPEAPDAHP